MFDFFFLNNVEKSYFLSIKNIWQKLSKQKHFSNTDSNELILLK